MQLYYVHKKDKNLAYGDENESRHLHKVLRNNVGDLANITPGDGTIWRAEILALSRSSVTFKPLKLIESVKQGPRLAVAVAPTKQASRIEDLVEKGVQWGMTDLYLIKTERTLRKDFKLKRIEQLAISTMKQCLRTHRLRIYDITNYSDFLKQIDFEYDHKYVGNLESKPPHLMKKNLAGHTLFLIGPEGDFTSEEYKMAEKNGFESVSLGKHRLRTEAAAMMAVLATQNKRMLEL